VCSRLSKFDGQLRTGVSPSSTIIKLQIHQTAGSGKKPEPEGHQ
jgi:hypothetical protein